MPDNSAERTFRTAQEAAAAGARDGRNDGNRGNRRLDPGGDSYNPGALGQPQEIQDAYNNAYDRTYDRTYNPQLAAADLKREIAAGDRIADERRQRVLDAERRGEPWPRV